MSECQIVTLAHNMLSYTNAYKIRGNSEEIIVFLIAASFSGQLKGWWDFYLIEEQRQAITSFVKLDARTGDTLLNAQGQPIPNGVYTLVINIYDQFIG